MSFDKEQANLRLQEFLQDRNNQSRRKKLIETHVPLAKKIAFDVFKKHSWLSESDLSDLMQESFFGLYDATRPDKFNPNKSSISTYMGLWCEARCLAHLRRLRKSNRLIFWEYKNIPWTKSSDEEENKIPIPALHKQNIYFLCDWDSYKESEISDNHDDKYHEHLMLFFDNLEIKSRKIFYERFLLSPQKTLEEIGNELELTKERVRQIESELILKLKDHFNGFDGYYYDNLKKDLSDKEKENLTQFHHSLNEMEKYVFEKRILLFKPRTKTEIKNKLGIDLLSVSEIESDLRGRINAILNRKEEIYRENILQC